MTIQISNYIKPFLKVPTQFNTNNYNFITSLALLMFQKSIFIVTVLQFLIIYIPLKTGNTVNDDNSNNEAQLIDNTLDQNDNTIIGISDDLYRLKRKLQLQRCL